MKIGIRDGKAAQPQVHEGNHVLTLIRIELRWHKNRFGELYKALHLTLTTDNGEIVSSMIPEFRSGIVATLAALGKLTLNLRDLLPEQLLALRGRQITGTVTHRLYRDVLCPNVTRINGRAV